MLSIYKIIINLLNIIAYIWWFCLKLVKSYKSYLNDMAVWNELGIVLVGKTLEENIQDCIKEAYNLHYEMKKMRTMPKNAKIVAEYLLYLADNITEFNNPEEQYHVLMDIEDFLLYKQHFINNLDKIQRKHYWKG